MKATGVILLVLGAVFFGLGLLNTAPNESPSVLDKLVGLAFLSAIPMMVVGFVALLVGLIAKRMR